MTDRSLTAGPAWNLARMARLTRKELRETLRDRRTVITLVLMPLLVYPLLNICFNKSLLATAQQVPQMVYLIGVDSRKEADLLDDLLGRGGQLLATKSTAGGEPLPLGGLMGPPGRESGEFRWFPESDLRGHVENQDVHVGVLVRFPATLMQDQSGPRPVICELLYRPDSPTSRQAVQFVEERLQALNHAVLRGRLARAGLPAGLPAESVRQPVATTGMVPFSLATLVPLVLILMTITGAVYPAIDLTAGERERGTLETLIAAPVSRMTLLVAKYIAVLTVAVLTAMINLLAMTVTILTSSLGGHLFPGGISWLLMIEIFALLILFAAFFSSILLTLTSFARSFKEAQAYLIPIMLLAISPGLLSLMPGVQLTGVLAVTPLVNIVLLSRDLLEGHASAAMSATAILSTFIYAAAALVVASKVFGNDALLYASRGSWSELFQRPADVRDRPTAAATVTCLAVMFPCYFLLANLAQRFTQNDLQRSLLVNVLVTIVVFGACPWLFSVIQRVRFVAGFQLRLPSLMALVAAALLGVSLWPFAHELFLFGRWSGLVNLDNAPLNELESWFRSFEQLPTVLVLVALAVVPAMLEEFFFRGYVMNGLRARFTGRQAIMVSSLLFGLFHVLTPSMLTPERFVPSTFLGLVLGWVCYRTGSVFPGMLLHAGHNGILLILIQRRQMLAEWGWNVQQHEHVPASWLVVALLVAGVAAALLVLGTRVRRGVRSDLLETLSGDAGPAAGPT